MPSHDVLLAAENLNKRFGDTQVLADVSLSVRAGERVALMGPSGAGKSTLLNCLGGVDRADSGVLRFDGVDLAQLTPEALAAVRRTRIGTVFQFFHLLPTLSAEENIALPLELLNWPAARKTERVAQLLKRVGLAERASHRPGELSGGEQQRVALARALAHSPSLLLADEPTGALDSHHGEAVLRLLREMTEEAGSTLILVTHSEEAASICERRIWMRDGRIERTHG
ncbi:ABC transporter ATP-binding protein [Nibricoccus sp. IMCC34717]|uniref:ABC transporter ATP-binding protein n=1 Tax=Nibricoccus sp. IMCC34717 TaxID=3034021 RepID=UPI00384BF46F